MAEIEPLRALHYDLAVVGPLADLVAPPYDVIDDSAASRPVERSPDNVVAMDLPRADGDPYEGAAEIFEAGSATGRWCGTPSRRFGYTPGLHRPGRAGANPPGFLLPGRIEAYGPGRVRPHERTHPGPKEDRLRLTRATTPTSRRSSPSTPTRQRRPGARSRPPTSQPPWAEIQTGTAPSTASGG